jgi:hypothetical protein
MVDGEDDDDDDERKKKNVNMKPLIWYLGRDILLYESTYIPVIILLLLPNPYYRTDYYLLGKCNTAIRTSIV